MTKIEELITKYKSIEDNYESNPNLDCHERGVEAGKADLSWRVVEDLEQLKSSLPKPVEVPEVVAEWIEHCRECSWNLRSAISFENFGNFDNKRNLKKWFLDGKEKNELFARAWLDGYTVVKEPLYYVILAEKKDGWKYTYWDDEGSADFTNKKEDIQTFTEKEIREKDERFWAFAVPVEEEE